MCCSLRVAIFMCCTKPKILSKMPFNSCFHRCTTLLSRYNNIILTKYFVWVHSKHE